MGGRGALALRLAPGGDRPHDDLHLVLAGRLRQDRRVAQDTVVQGVLSLRTRHGYRSIIWLIILKVIQLNWQQLNTGL